MDDKVAVMGMAVTLIAKYYGIKRIFLFGSYAKGKVNEDSDIDMLVKKGKPMSLIHLSLHKEGVEKYEKVLFQGMYCYIDAGFHFYDVSGI